MFQSLNIPPAKVLLIVPPSGDDMFIYSTPSLGLGYIGASLLSHGHNVKSVDLTFYTDTTTYLNDVINDFQPQIVGITGVTFRYPEIIKILDIIKKISPNIVTVLGGVHASVLGESILKEHDSVDYIIRGEGELSFPKLLEAFYKRSDFSNISGLVYRDNGRIFSNPPKFIDNLDDLAYPWKIINPLDYQKGKVHGFICRQLPVAQVISSRGCPYLCSFCAGGQLLGHKVRTRDPVSFVDEIEYLKDNFGIKEIQIVDDNFTFNRNHAITVCKELIKRKLGLSWSLPNGVRADRLDGELLKMMKKAGCYYLAFGVEFGSPRILQITNKSLNLEQARRNIILANKLGFITQGFFLMGYPQETIEDIRLTRRFIKSVPFDKVLINLPFPYPGTDLFEYYIKNRYLDIKNINWATFKEFKFERIFENIISDAVLRERKDALVKFYTNPINMVRFFLKFKTWVQIKSAFYGFMVCLDCFKGNR